MRNSILALALGVLVASCNTGTPNTTPEPGPDAAAEDTVGDAGLPDLAALDAASDVVADTPTDSNEFEAIPACEPGTGCFGDPCEDNKDCLSGWCVDHLGGSTCTDTCQEDCPAGWTCRQAGTTPDVVWVCVSDLPSLCLPCATNTDCVSLTGIQSPCLDYGDEGSFCGGACEDDDDCPGGYACQEAQTVDGATLTQCVAVTGVCSCTDKAISLGLSTPCASENEYGSCNGHRVCTEEGLSACDAAVPADESCDGLDDDCDGQVDEETCDDENPCTEDVCLGATGCDHLALDGGECADGDPCTAADHCVAGVCVGDPVLCDDQNPCTDDSCTEAGGCEHMPNTIDCDDGDPCTVADECGDGVCAGTPVACDCIEDADCAALEDGDLCNGTLVCDTEGLPYQCVVDPATIIECPETVGADAPCLVAACDPQTGACGVAPGPDGVSCDDEDACTVGDACAFGSCLGGPAMVCGDLNPCTDDGCDPNSGCSFIANNGACDDGNPCTLSDGCVDGSCVGAGALDCDDGDTCTTDTCDPDAGGCLHTLNQVACDDGDLCTTGDHCHLGSCIAGGTLACDDGNVCTDDACDSATGCTFTPNAAACDDGNPCTLGDHCVGCWCVPTGFEDCDDGNLCTDDACDPLGGCVHANNAVPCDDGDVCTTTDVCSAGICVGSGALQCDDGDPCTTDSCDPESGCSTETVFPCCGNEVVEPPETCDDGNQAAGDGCDADCQDESGGCVQIGVDVRTLEQPPENWQLGVGGPTDLCEDTPTTIPMGWHIATEAELIHLSPMLEFGACAVYGICGCYWYGAGTKLTDCDALHYTCTTGGCTAYTTHCYCQVLLIRDGKDGTCHTGG